MLLRFAISAARYDLFGNPVMRLQASAARLQAKVVGRELGFPESSKSLQPAARVTQLPRRPQA